MKLGSSCCKISWVSIQSTKMVFCGYERIMLIVVPDAFAATVVQCLAENLNSEAH